MSDIINIITNSALMLKLTGILLIVNAVLSGVSLVIEKLVALGELKKDNGFVAMFLKIAGIVQKLLDFVSANRAH